MGSHSLSASYTGDSIFSGAASATQTLVVALAVPTVTLSAPSTALPGAAVTLSAIVSGSGGTPTGTITFKDGTTTIATVTLASGTAGTTTSTLAAGAHSLTASYSGDSVFSAVTSAATTVTIGVAASLSFAASPTSLTITRGSSGTITITGTPVGGYAGAATFACGALPAAASCVFAPASLTFAGNNSAQSTTLTIATAPAQARLQPLPLANGGAVIALALLFPFSAALRRRKALPRGCLLLLLLAGSLAGAASLTGCANNSSTTPAGSYTIPVVVTAGSATSTLNIAVTVQ